MSTTPNIKSLEQQAAAAIESGDLSDISDFLQATGLNPTPFQAMLQAEGPEKVLLAVSEHKLQQALETLIPHVLHYASMTHSQLGIDRDAANARKAIGGSVDEKQQALETLIPHALRYASMPRSHTNAYHDATNARAAINERAVLQASLQPPSAEKLSAAFTEVIGETLSAEQLAAVRERNAQASYRDSCATHDFCDANEAMAKAWEAVIGSPIDHNSHSQAKLWNDAWQLSKQSGFAPAGQQVATLDQGALADKAFAAYDFGKGVEVLDASSWEYDSPGNERSRKVYVETEPEDDGPAPRWDLNFTVTFDPETGALSEAYALDQKGSFWGNLPENYLSEDHSPTDQSTPAERDKASLTALLDTALPADSGYEKGYRDAIESMVLALGDQLTSDQLKNIVTTALDAYENNAEHDDSPSPGM